MIIVLTYLNNFSTFAGEFMSNNRHPLTITFDVSHIGQVTGIVNCSNYVSWRTVNIDFNIAQPIVGLNVSISTFIAAIGQDVDFIISAQKGSSVSATLNFGDGSPVTASFPLLLAQDQDISLTHQFYVHNNYTISATATNDISSDSFWLPDRLIVQKVITNISLAVPGVGNIDDGMMTFHLLLDPGARPPGEIFSIKFNQLF